MNLDRRNFLIDSEDVHDELQQHTATLSFLAFLNQRTWCRPVPERWVHFA